MDIGMGLLELLYTRTRARRTMPRQELTMEK